MKNQKGSANMAIVISVVVVAFIAGYFAFNNFRTQPTPEHTNAVTILSPNGGEKFTIGENIQFSWTRPGTSSVQLYLFRGSNIPSPLTLGDQIVIGERIEGSSISWKIPTSLEPGPYFLRLLCNFCGAPESIDYSDASFTIEAPDETANWQVYKWGALSFKYPNDWVVSKDLYMTPAQQANGDKPSVVGLSIKPDDKSQEGISIGGRQFGCRPSPEGKCLTLFMAPFTTASDDPKVLGVFKKIVMSARMENNGIEILSPQPNEEWESGRTYVVKWNSIEPTITNTQLQMINTSAGEGIDGLVILQNNLSVDGELKITIPKGESPEGSEKLYGPYTLEVNSLVPIIPPPTGILGASKIYQAYSAPFFIKSTTGEPYFPPIPRG